MYVFSRFPFIFGQPFIRKALTSAGYGAHTSLVSGTVTFLMMLISLAATSVAQQLRDRLGLAGILLLEFGLQVTLTATLTASTGNFVIGLPFLRMMPDTLSQLFIKARIQQLLRTGVRATYMSVQSVAGRNLLAATVSFPAMQTTKEQALPHADMQLILAVYAAIGFVVLAALFMTARKSRV